MMKKSYLFGACGLELDAARSTIEQALGLTLAAHESDYYGGNYYRFDGDSHLVLRTNFLDDDGEMAEAEYTETVLLYLDGEAANADGVAAVVSQRLSLFRQLRTSSY